MASADQVIEWLEEIVRHGVNTTTWEDEFVERLQGRVDRYGDRVKFSELEVAKVEEIYAERVP